ncbi:hypothetical protein ACIRPT_19770 [Streptomyces sp. NPDC101227]|uniref:hypothetical protein n=1 Tax=Streptomyces sp. NPDC101227 TaxID=3366136 RepID=UPI00382681EF
MNWDFYRKRTVRGVAVLLIYVTAMALIGTVSGIVKGSPGAVRFVLITPVLVGFTVAAVLGWRKDKAGMTYVAGIGYVVFCGCVTLLLR